jgi:hypothetical protein
MTAERMAALVGRWVRFYTRRLPGEIAQRRVDEIDADLHDQIAHGRAQGTSDPRIALGILSRMLRGLAADLSWRTRHANAAAHPSTLKDTVKTSTSLPIRRSRRPRRGLDPVAAVGGRADRRRRGLEPGGLRRRRRPPGVIGVALELAARRAGSLPAAFGIAAFGVAAAVFGEADDAPGLVLLGILLIASACALGARTAQRSR